MDEKIDDIWQFIAEVLREHERAKNGHAEPASEPAAGAGTVDAAVVATDGKARGWE